MKMVILAAGLGTRMREVCGDRPKTLTDLGGETILDRLLATAHELRLEPMIVTRPELVAWFESTPAEVLVEERPIGMITTLFQTRDLLHEPFVWVAGDVVFTAAEPLRELVAGHRSGDFASYFFCRTDRFKAKIRFEPGLELIVTRQGEWCFSSPCFGVQSPRIFSYLEGDTEGQFVAKALAAGETLSLREYPHPVFEIDTPLDLAEARSYFARCEHRASIS
jgi:GTP:adenosylcobinamide-phosphate guanylyltransferase